MQHSIYNNNNNNNFNTGLVLSLNTLLTGSLLIGFSSTTRLSTREPINRLNY